MKKEEYVIESLFETNLQPTNYHLGREFSGKAILHSIKLEMSVIDSCEYYVGYTELNEVIFKIPKYSVMAFYKFENGKAVTK